MIIETRLYVRTHHVGPKHKGAQTTNGHLCLACLKDDPHPRARHAATDKPGVLLCQKEETHRQ